MTIFRSQGGQNYALTGGQNFALITIYGSETSTQDRIVGALAAGVQFGVDNTKEAVFPPIVVEGVERAVGIRPGEEADALVGGFVGNSDGAPYNKGKMEGEGAILMVMALDMAIPGGLLRLPQQPRGVMTDFTEGMSGRTGIMSPVREGKLLGEGVGEWSSTRRGVGVTVSELPGPAGEILPRYLTNQEMKAISEHFEGIEFVLVRGRDAAGEPYYLLMSGRAGEVGRVRFGINGSQTLVSHTHPPGGDAFASVLDRQTLDNAANGVSRIILLDGADGKLITFSPMNTQLSIRPMRPVK